MVLAVEAGWPPKSGFGVEALVAEGKEKGDEDGLGFASASGAFALVVCAPKVNGEVAGAFVDGPFVPGTWPPKNGDGVGAASLDVPGAFTEAPNNGEGEPTPPSPATFELVGTAVPKSGFGTTEAGGVDLGVSESLTDVAKDGAAAVFEENSNFGGVVLGVVDSTAAVVGVLLARNGESAKKFGMPPADGVEGVFSSFTTGVDVKKFLGASGAHAVGCADVGIAKDTDGACGAEGFPDTVAAGAGAGIMGLMSSSSSG